ncbi:hypothetical protein KAI04_04735 [Candidatus Pacearchaeota archaeon]|nr:hypothetical protein [Candidatus Pacearchaeota archaeon]
MKLKWSGFVFILIGFVFIINSSFKSITGNIIQEGIHLSGSILGFVFLIAGLVLFLASKKAGGLEKNLAKQILASGKILSKPREFKKIALEMNYNFGKEVKEGTQILDKYGKILTVIPKHNISKRVYHSILKAFSTGESNLRRSGYQVA